MRFVSLWGGRKTCSRGVSYRPCVQILEDRSLPSFIAAPGYASGAYPSALALGDFNGDGVPDLAVANQGTQPNYSDSSVSVLLGAGDGTFQPARNYPVGPDPLSVAVGDFNGDGLLDLAVTNNIYSGQVSIFLGKGDGTFAAPMNYPVGSLPGSVVVGDFNGDGTPDLVITYLLNPNTISVLLGNGDGSFGPAERYAAGPSATAVAVGDFNGDGVLDLAVANSEMYVPGTVSILLGNGDGTFAAPQGYAVGEQPVALTVADFNGDGVQDLAVADSRDSMLSILLGRGDGTFQPSLNSLVGVDPADLTAGDFNGDGIPDLAVTGRGVWVLLGQGDGTFTVAGTYAPASSPGSIMADDVNGDGIPDLVMADGSPDGAAAVMVGLGDGTFVAAPTYAAGNLPVAEAVGDFNGDGVPDLAAADASGHEIQVLLGNGDGTFAAPQSYLAGTRPVAVVTGDFNGDGILDLAVGNETSDDISILLGNGDGTFRAPLNFAAGHSRGAVRSVAVGDLNGDGTLDLAVADSADFSGTVDIFLGHGDGTFTAAESYATGPNPEGVVAGDFNGDGIPDLAVANAGYSPSYADGNVSVFLGNGDGTFQSARTFAAGLAPWSVAVGDFNGDGLLDVAVADYGSGMVSILLGNGDGTLADPQSYSTGARARSVAVGDLNGGGIPDLAVANYLAGTVSVWLGVGDGTFAGLQNYAVGGAPDAVAAGDFNGDGFLDLAVVQPAFGRVAVLRNAADWDGGPTGALRHPRLPVRPLTAVARPAWNLLVTPGATQDRHTLIPSPQVIADRPPHLLPTATTTGPGHGAQYTEPRMPLLRTVARHAADAVFAAWAGPLTEELERLPLTG